MLQTLRIGRRNGLSFRRPAPLQPARLHHDLARIMRRSRPLLKQATQELLTPSATSLAVIMQAVYS